MRGYRWETRGPDPNPSENLHKTIGSLSNTGPDSLKTKPALVQPASETDGTLLMLPSSTKSVVGVGSRLTNPSVSAHMLALCCICQDLIRSCSYPRSPNVLY